MSQGSKAGTKAGTKAGPKAVQAVDPKADGRADGKSGPGAGAPKRMKPAEILREFFHPLDLLCVAVTAWVVDSSWRLFVTASFFVSLILLLGGAFLDASAPSAAGPSRAAAPASAAADPISIPAPGASAPVPRQPVPARPAPTPTPTPPPVLNPAPNAGSQAAPVQAPFVIVRPR